MKTVNRLETHVRINVMSFSNLTCFYDYLTIFCHCSLSLGLFSGSKKKTLLDQKRKLYWPKSFVFMVRFRKVHFRANQVYS